MIAKYRFDQCAAYPKNTTFFSNIKVIFLPANCATQPQPLYLGVIHAFKCHYRKQLISKTAATIDGGLLQDAEQMELGVLSAVHFIAELLKLITPTSIKCGFLIDHVSSNNDSAVKPTENKEDDWHSLQPL
jgi:hypothetical protein